MASRIEGAYEYTGAVKFLSSVTFSSASISNVHIAADAAIEHTKLEHQHRAAWHTTGTSSSNAGEVFAGVRGTTGDVLEIKASSLTACTGNAYYTVDVLKGTTSLLASSITINSSNTAVTGTLIGSPTLAAGDVIKVITTANAGTGSLGTGLYVLCTWNEDAS